MNDDEVTGELTLRSKGEFVHLPDIPQPVISALHEAAMGVKDHLEIFKYRLIAIRIEDIRQIYEMLSQWTLQYNIQSKVTQIIAEHRSADAGSTTSRRVFRSVEDFLRYDDSNIDPVRLLTVRFSFILKNPNSNRLESYDLTLEFPEAVEWRHDLLTGTPAADHYAFVYRGSDNWSFKLRVEYSDYVTAVALQSMIVSWYMTLDGKGREWVARKSKFYERLFHHSHFLIFSPGTFVAKWLPIIFSFLISLSLLRAAQQWLGFPGAWIALFSSFLLLTMIVEYGVRRLIGMGEKAMVSSSRVPLLLLNAGNRKIYEAERDAIVKGGDRKRFLGKFLFGSILLSMVVSVCANIVTYFIW